MTKYSAQSSPHRTPQTEQADARQVENSAGGFTFGLTIWQRLDRFLVLNSDGPTYYATEQTLTKENSKCVLACIAEDGPRTVAKIVEISDAGRAHRNDAAIYALSLCAGAKDQVTRKVAYAAIPKVCRIGTHLLSFCQDLSGGPAWGRALKRAVGAWYTDRTADQLAYQVAKYQSRNGWSQRDVLRLAHPVPTTPGHAAVFRYVAKGGVVGMEAESKRGKPIARTELPALIQAVEEIHSGVDVKRACALIREHRLPHECVPNEMKDKPEIWAAMLESMGLTAQIRNLGKMTSVGLIAPLSEAAKAIRTNLGDRDSIKKARVHPMAILLALRTYQSGHGFKGKLSWNAERSIVDALDEAFYLAFDNVVPTGKNIMLALDVSGSMASPMANTNVTCREASAAMALITARTEKEWMACGFSDGGGGGFWNRGGNTLLTTLNISPKQRLDDVVKAISNIPFGGTDCALPMLHALKENIAIDCFQILTDSETWHGQVHPHQALDAYRRKKNRPHAKLAVVGMVSNGFTISHPDDPHSRDFVGFSTDTPSAIADFIREE